MAKKTDLIAGGYPASIADGYGPFAFLSHSRRVSFPRDIAARTDIYFLPLPSDPRDLLSDDAASYLAESVELVRKHAGDDAARDLFDLVSDVRSYVADAIGVDWRALAPIAVVRRPYRGPERVGIGSSLGTTHYE
jgi:hypothetical protein